jgi:hypothetical protein
VEAPVVGVSCVAITDCVLTLCGAPPIPGDAALVESCDCTWFGYRYHTVVVWKSHIVPSELHVVTNCSTRHQLGVFNTRGQFHPFHSTRQGLWLKIAYVSSGCCAWLSMFSQDVVHGCQGTGRGSISPIKEFVLARIALHHEHGHRATSGLYNIKPGACTHRKYIPG